MHRSWSYSWDVEKLDRRRMRRSCSHSFVNPQNLSCYDLKVANLTSKMLALADDGERELGTAEQGPRQAWKASQGKRKTSKATQGASRQEV